MSYDYFDEVKKSVIAQIPKHYTPEQYNKLSEEGYLKIDLEDKFFTNDKVTGNGSGSFTNNVSTAKDYVFGDEFKTIKWAIRDAYYTQDEFENDMVNDNWERIDVICRCFVLGMACQEITEEHPTFDY